MSVDLDSNHLQFESCLHFLDAGFSDNKHQSQDFVLS